MTAAVTAGQLSERVGVAGCPYHELRSGGDGEGVEVDIVGGQIGVQRHFAVDRHRLGDIRARISRKARHRTRPCAGQRGGARPDGHIVSRIVR